MFNPEKQLCGWHNKISGEEKIVGQEQDLIDFAFSGIQIINSKIFDLINQTGKFSIIDTYLDLAATQKIIAYDHSGSILMDVGKPESILKAEKIFE